MMRLLILLCLSSLTSCGGGSEKEKQDQWLNELNQKITAIKYDSENVKILAE